MSTLEMLLKMNKTFNEAQLIMYIKSYIGRFMHTHVACMQRAKSSKLRVYEEEMRTSNNSCNSTREALQVGGYEETQTGLKEDEEYRFSIRYFISFVIQV